MLTKKGTLLRTEIYVKVHAYAYMYGIEKKHCPCRSLAFSTSNADNRRGICNFYRYIVGIIVCLQTFEVGGNSFAFRFKFLEISV